MSAYPNRPQFRHWVISTVHGNAYLHMPPTSPDALSRMSSLAAFPEDVAHFDKHAAELLRKARDAHDELTTYLVARDEANV